ncbi:MAG TPA: cupin domain-containing protein [Phenylobacterium sp.]|nr:cupin domain-containing protein [Phenylobacterium sp.]
MAAAALAVAPQASRTVLTRVDVAGTDREVVFGRADLPKGAQIARHTHPGEEVGVLWNGELTLKIDGAPDRRLKAGDTYVIPRGAPHAAVGESDETATLVASWVIDKGQALASPAP